MPETMTRESVKDPKVKNGEFDITKRATAIATDKAPFHKEGDEINESLLLIEKMKLNGWAK